VQKRLAANRPDLAVTKDSGERHIVERIGKDRGVMIRHAKQTFPAACAREQQNAELVGRFIFGTLGNSEQILMGRPKIAQLKLYGLSSAWISAHCYGPDLGVGSQNIPDQEIALLKILNIFGGSQTKKQVVLNRQPFLSRDAEKSGLESLVSGQVADFENEIVFNFSDRNCIADWPTSLAD
jgi:hypothetical protein